MTSEVFAPAKINLTLHVTGQRADGYHLLDSLVVFADVGDRLTITDAPDMAITVTGPFAPGVPTDARNLVWQAARRAGHSCHIKLEKNLPHGAGIGGGSSDAAAVLRHYGISEGCGELGADIPVCLAASPQRVRGTGDLLHPLTDLPVLPAVLVNPGVHVATPVIFDALERKDHPGMPEEIPTFAGPDSLIKWLARQRNDLEAPAVQVAPEIGVVLAALKASPHCRLARMSGSGATCFALCDDLDAARKLSKEIIQAYPTWWNVVTMLGETP